MDTMYKFDMALQTAFMEGPSDEFVTWANNLIQWGEIKKSHGSDAWKWDEWLESVLRDLSGYRSSDWFGYSEDAYEDAYEDECLRRYWEETKEREIASGKWTPFITTTEEEAAKIMARSVFEALEYNSWPCSVYPVMGLFCYAYCFCKYGTDPDAFKRLFVRGWGEYYTSILIWTASLPPLTLNRDDDDLPF